MEHEEPNTASEHRVFKPTNLNSKKSNYTNETALEALKSGDREAFGWIYCKFYLQLCFHAETMIECDETSKEAEDLVQDLFANLWASRETLVVKASLKSYLFGSIRNLCMNYIKHLNRRRDCHNSILAESSEASNSDNPLSMMMAKETKLAIERAMSVLPEQDRKILTLAFYEELSYKEIAEEMGISENSVGSLLQRAKEKLMKILIPS